MQNYTGESVRMKSGEESENCFSYVLITLSLVGATITIVASWVILILVLWTKRLHTVSHLLICNTSISSIFYCIIQCINYIYSSLTLRKADDPSCRWRGYFGYIAVGAIAYSYLIQGLSRFLVSTLSGKYRWVILLKSQFIFICCQWIIVSLLPIPSIFLDDIYFHPLSFCRQEKYYPIHIAYTIIVYYLIPTILIFTIYIYIYLRIKRSRLSIITISARRSNRDLEIVFNMIILFAIYIIGAIPIILYLLSDIHVLYEVGIFTTSLTISIEKLSTIFLDRDIRNLFKIYLRRTMTQIQPIS